MFLNIKAAFWKHNVFISVKTASVFKLLDLLRFRGELNELGYAVLSWKLSHF